MTLELSAEQLQAMKAHAELTYPDECCGLLLGRAADTTRVMEIWATDNAWDSQAADDLGDTSMLAKSRRYWIAPKEMLAAMRYAQSRHLDVVGIYHSHPDQPAVPSECDRHLAWQHYSYMIVSVEQGKATAYQSWTVDDYQQFQLEAILIANLPKAESN